MVVYCFDVLQTALAGAPPPPLPRFSTAGRFPLFVTFEKEDTVHRRPAGGAMVRPEPPVLRGCIGCLSPCALHELGHYTRSAAFGDDRFAPIAAEELPALRCQVSLLAYFERAAGVWDWCLGQHGITIDFDVAEAPYARTRHYNATYLPEIAPEQGWSKREAIESLVRKAGYGGRIDAALLRSIALTRYQSQRCRLTYAEYQQHCSARRRQSEQLPVGLQGS